MLEEDYGEGAGKYYNMVVLTNKKLLTDDSCTDLVIKVGNETVSAHAAIISCRCPEIVGFPQDDKKKNAKKKLEVKVNGVQNAQILSKVLEYLYTGQVDFVKVADREILLLGSAARNLKLNRLVYLCEKWLREHMTIESVFHLLKAATELNEARAKGFCLAFALQHYNEFISNKDGIYILGIELFQEVVAAFQTNPEPPKEIRPEECPDTLLEDFKRMYELMPYSDAIFTVGSENIKIHKAILIAHSDSFAGLLRDDSGLRLSPGAFKSMLKFLYYGDDNIEPLPACELIAFSRSNKLPALNRICEDKIRDSISIGTVLNILSVSYLASPDGKLDLVNELRAKCFPFILSNLNEIDFSRLRTFNPMMIVDLLLELQTAAKKGEYGLTSILQGAAQEPDRRGGSSRNAPASEPPKQAPPTVGVAPASGGSQGGLLGQQRSRQVPPPPPRNPRGDSGGIPAPPPRDKPLPPPSLSTPPIGAPPPSLSTPGAASEEDSTEDSDSARGKKKSSGKKKDDDKRKKDKSRTKADKKSSSKK